MENMTPSHLPQSSTSCLWHRIENWPKYWINNEGRIWNDQDEVWLKPAYITSLCNTREQRETFSVPKLVAKYFLPPIPIGYDIIHKDGDKSNNHVDNLAYVSKSESSLRGSEKKKDNSAKKLGMIVATKDGSEYFYGRTIREMAEKINVGKSTVALGIEDGRVHAGYYFWRVKE